MINFHLSFSMTLLQLVVYTGAQPLSLTNEHLVYTLVLAQLGRIAATITCHRIQNGGARELLKPLNFSIFCYY